MPNAYEIDFLRVGEGNGDAIVIRYAENAGDSFYLHVVDGGFTDTGDAIISHIESHYGKGLTIGHVVLTHADNDHACGLIKILEHFNVYKVWMNRPWLYVDYVLDKFDPRFGREGLIQRMRYMHPYLVEMEKIAERKGINIGDPFQGQDIGPFKVLAPSPLRYVQLIPDLDKTPPSWADVQPPSGGYIADAFRSAAQKVLERLDFETLDNNPPPTSASNESSVVQLGTFGNSHILLTGDVGPEGLDEAAAYAQSLGIPGRLKLMQVPHHGSRRNVTPHVLDRWLGDYPAEFRGTAIASVGIGKAGEFPRKRVSNAFRRRGYPVSITEKEWFCSYEGYPTRIGSETPNTIPFSPEVED